MSLKNGSLPNKGRLSINILSLSLSLTHTYTPVLE